MRIDVYISSISLTQDYDALIYSRAHNACAPDLLRQMDKSLNGRAISPDSVLLLEKLGSLPEQLGDDIKLYDVGRASGWLKAMIAGINQTPALVVDGEKYLGLQAAKDRLAFLIERSSPQHAG